MPEVMQHPEEPEMLSRKAGRDIYGTSAGMLRRTELFRLGNAWGFKFPAGATKDFMLPYFQQLEADGKDPLRPPGNKTLNEIVTSREVEFDGTNVAENDLAERALEKEEHKANVFEEALVKPNLGPDEFELKLQKARIWEVRKLCKERGIAYSTRDRKVDLVARIMDTIGDRNDEDSSTGRE